MSDYPAKQVIIMRRDLRNTQGQKIRTGKLCAQAAHASLGAYKQADKTDPAFQSWDNGQFAKITLGVDSEAELLEIAEAGMNEGLNVKIIIDAGYTEFGGVPTLTCIGIGPHYHHQIDPITGHLKPY